MAEAAAALRSFTLYDATQLLEELRAWKLETADRSVVAEEVAAEDAEAAAIASGVRVGPWADCAAGDVGNGASRVAAPVVPTQSTVNVLDLSACPPSPDLRPDTPGDADAAGSKFGAVELQPALATRPSSSSSYRPTSGLAPLRTTLSVPVAGGGSGGSAQAGTSSSGTYQPLENKRPGSREAARCVVGRHAGSLQLSSSGLQRGVAGCVQHQGWDAPPQPGYNRAVGRTVLNKVVQDARRMIQQQQQQQRHTREGAAAGGGSGASCHSPATRTPSARMCGSSGKDTHSGDAQQQAVGSGHLGGGGGLRPTSGASPQSGRTQAPQLPVLHTHQPVSSR